MISVGPIIFGLLLGIIIGSQIKTGNISDTSFKTSSYVIIIIAGLIMAWQLGEFPFYDYFPLSTAFASALIGVLLSKFIFARSS
ncbi:MAG: energy-converting hydrogenase B subunit J [Methanobrevibacter sp.]|jgi:energy-converting hydrogenase B subunit J|uniref:Energy-converting hydrogenase B subunit J n=1 Tax=Methanobrevibacter millerae TaxID=230361 RepID=A0A8T3VSD6_9EURY|nr:energy-converting hydrogenase B subunit J [Methanobrevibacter sp.]MBE6510539.1 energy-converting hydrogenase B subunit J [Methanobrevibacter millerae]MBO5151696.1 energy-converting hydrogenase B subunit J [Methanobrevibacter sp.]